MDDVKNLESGLSKKELEELKERVNSGVKLSSKKSRLFGKINEKKNFEQMVNNANEQHQNYLSEAFELGKQYKELISDKIITDNKGYLVENREQEVIGKLIDYAVRVNNDKIEQKCMGSVTLLTLALKCIIKLRDRYNDIEYKYHILERNHIRLEEKFNRISSQTKLDENK